MCVCCEPRREAGPTRFSPPGRRRASNALVHVQARHVWPPLPSAWDCLRNYHSANKKGPTTTHPIRPPSGPWPLPQWPARGLGLRSGPPLAREVEEAPRGPRPRPAPSPGEGRERCRIHDDRNEGRANVAAIQPCGTIGSPAGVVVPASQKNNEGNNHSTSVMGR